MSSSVLSATFHWPGVPHVIEVVHQRGRRQHLQGLRMSAWDEHGKQVDDYDVPTFLDTLMLAPVASRQLVLFEADYDSRRFPYRPHQYGLLEDRLYYALNAALGGLPARLGIRQPPLETYEVAPSTMRWAVLIANPATFAESRTVITATYTGGRRERHDITLGPKAHAEVSIASKDLLTIGTRSTYRVVTYVTAYGPDGRRHVYDHLFPVVTVRQ